MKSFNNTFKQMKTNQFHNTRSINIHQLKRRDFKTEKYGLFFTLSKCLSDWKLLQYALKLIFKKIKRSEIKTLSQTTFLINTKNNSEKNKQPQISSTPYIFVLCHFYLYLSQSLSCFFLSSLCFLFSFLPFCLHRHKELDLILSRILISPQFGC